MLSVLRQHNFALLWVGGLLSAVGTWALYTALPFYVYERTGSALATGAMFVAQMIPRIVLAPVAGVYVDRWDRRRTMIVADITRALLLLPLVTIHSRDWFWVVYVVAFGEATLSQFFDPAGNSLVPRLVGESSLTAANSLNALTGALTRLLAPALGGTLLAVLGLTSVVLTDSASYLVSATLMCLIRIPRSRASPPTPAGDANITVRHSIWRDWREGAQTVCEEPTLRALFLIGGVVLAGYGMITVLLVVFVQEVLRESALVFGGLAAAQGIGGLLGAIVTGWLGKAWSSARVITAGLLATGLLYLLTFNVPLVPVDVTLVAIMGLPITSFWISSTGLLQQHSPDGYRGRMFGAYGAITSLTTLAGMVFAGFGVSPLGILPTLDVAAGFYLVGGVFALTLLPGAGERRLEDECDRTGTGAEFSVLNAESAEGASGHRAE